MKKSMRDKYKIQLILVAPLALAMSFSAVNAQAKEKSSSVTAKLPPFSMDSFGAAVRNLKNAKPKSNNAAIGIKLSAHAHDSSCSAESHEFDAMMQALQHRIEAGKKYVVDKADQDKLKVIMRENSALEGALSKSKIEWQKQVSSSNLVKEDIALRQEKLNDIKELSDDAEINSILTDVENALKEAQNALKVDMGKVEADAKAKTILDKAAKDKTAKDKTVWPKKKTDDKDTDN